MSLELLNIFIYFNEQLYNKRVVFSSCVTISIKPFCTFYSHVCVSYES